MIEPNFNLLLWIILITSVLSGVCNIIAGAMGIDKSQKYGIADVFNGIIVLGLCAWVVLS